MRELIRSLTLVVTLLGITSSAVASAYLKRPGFEVQANPSAMTVMFINGIKNTEPQAVKSSEKLISSLKDSGLPQLTYSFTYLYNPTDDLYPDYREILVQAGISDSFLAPANGAVNEYYMRLGGYYNSQYAMVNSLSGVQKRIVSFSGQLKKSIEYILTTSGGLILVPHSQGNFYVEAAYAMLYAEGKASLLPRIRVVGVGDAAKTTASNRYITHTSDRVINGERLRTADLLYFKPLAANETACIGSFCGEGISWAGFIDYTAHGFQEVYLNPELISQSSGITFPRIIYGFVSKSLGEIESISPSIVSIYFTGAVSSVAVNPSSSVPGGIMVGMPLSGTLSYNPTLIPAPVIDGPYMEYSFQNGDAKASITVNGYTWTTGKNVFVVVIPDGSVQVQARCALAGDLSGVFGACPQFVAGNTSGAGFNFVIGAPGSGGRFMLSTVLPISASGFNVAGLQNACCSQLVDNGPVLAYNITFATDPSSIKVTGP